MGIAGRESTGAKIESTGANRESIGANRESTGAKIESTGAKNGLEPMLLLGLSKKTIYLSSY